MVKVNFDPPEGINWNKLSKKNLRGGALKGKQREEYVMLCRLITSRDPSLDYLALMDKILEIMYHDVNEHIGTLPDDIQGAFLTDIDTFYKGIDKTDNPFNCINIFGLYISILFTKYFEEKKTHEESPELYFIRFEHAHTRIDYLQIMKIDKWKTYALLKGTAGQINLHFLIKNGDPREGIPKTRPIFMVFLGFLTLGEMMETMLDNVFLCDLSYTLEYVDGMKINPLTSLWHDGSFHYNNYRNWLELPNVLEEIREFHKYISTKDKATRYAINFVLFFILHESDNFDDVKIEENSLNNTLFNKISKEFIYDILQENFMSQLEFLYYQGYAIPSDYRVITNKEAGPADKKGKLDREEIKGFLRIVSSIYVNTYMEYKKKKEAEKQGGGRKTRKRRLRIRTISRKYKS